MPTLRERIATKSALGSLPPCYIDRMLGSILGVLVGAGVIYGCCRLVDKDGSNAGVWIVLVVAVWATCQSALEVGRYLLGA